MGLPSASSSLISRRFLLLVGDVILRVGADLGGVIAGFTNVSAVVDMPASTLRRSRSARSAALIVRGNSAQVIFVGGGDVHGTPAKFSRCGRGAWQRVIYAPRRSSARRREVTSVRKTSCGSMHHHMGSIVVNIEAASNRRCLGLPMSTVGATGTTVAVTGAAMGVGSSRGVSRPCQTH